MVKVAHTSLVYFRLSENWIHTQIKHLKDCESVVFTNETENLEDLDWKPRIFSRTARLPHGLREADSLAMWVLGCYPSFYLQARRENVDLIHAHFGPMGYLSAALAQKLGVPLVTTFYGYDASLLPQQEPGWNSRYKKLFSRGSRFLVEGPAMKQKLQNLGCPGQKIRVHHLGIELDKYPVREKFSPGPSLRILMAGRFVEKKGFIYGLKAFRRYLESGGEGSLTIVGDSSDSPDSRQIKKELLDYVERYRMQDAVSFTGMIALEELRCEYYRHDLFLAPSVQAGNGDNEGGAPVTIIEAGATGMAVIGSRHCDIPEVVKDGQTGLLCPEKEVEPIAEHLIKLYQNPPYRETLSRAGAKHIRQHFNAAEQGKILSEIYLDCLKR